MGGKRQRFRRIASVQTREAAHAEARRLMMRAAETGAVEEEDTSDQMVAFDTFVDKVFRPVLLPTYRPLTRERYEAHVLRHLKKLQRSSESRAIVSLLEALLLLDVIRRGASLEAVRLLARHGCLSVTGRYVYALGKDLEVAVARLDSPPTRC